MNHWYDDVLYIKYGHLSIVSILSTLQRDLIDGWRLELKDTAHILFILSYFKKYVKDGGNALNWWNNLWAHKNCFLWICQGIRGNTVFSIIFYGVRKYILLFLLRMKHVRHCMIFKMEIGFLQVMIYLFHLWRNLLNLITRFMWNEKIVLLH